MRVGKFAMAVTLIWAGSLGLDLARSAEPSQPKYKVIRETATPVPMRDGVHLGADIYRPDAPGKFPVITELRYFRGKHQNQQAQFFAERGYVVALVDSRGRGDSEGEWMPYVNEPKDGYDSQQWLGTQPWSNGKVGTFGISYNSFTQMMPAPLGSPYLKCMIPQEGQQTNFGHIYNDGVMQLNMVFQAGVYTSGKLQTQKIADINDPFYLQLPLLKVADDFPQSPHVRDWFAHPSYDDYWKAYGVKEKYGQIKAPALFVTGWYDNLVHEGFRNFEGMRTQGGSVEAREQTKIVVGPWIHGGSLRWPDLVLTELHWFDHWLKGVDTGIDKQAPLRLYVMGAEMWRDEYEWPLKRTRFTPYYLTSDGKANSVQGNGRLTAEAPGKKSHTDTFVYDPAKPVYTQGGQISTLNPGARDRRATQERDDILVYTTEPLAADTEVTGPVNVKLYAASSAVNTDFTATITDVYPDGMALHVCEGIRGVTFRESLEHPTLIEPGKVYEYTIDLWETSMVFKAGHRIRLEISSSNFPRYARNQNIAAPLGTSADIKQATQTIYHDAEHPSALILPVIPAP